MRKSGLAALIALLWLGASAHAETFPSRPLTIVVPFAAGGPSDVMSRILAERMKTSLGEAVVVEDVTGAGGTVGVGRVVHSAPDGYTIGFGHLGTHVANGAIYKLNYDLIADLEPVVLLPSNPMIIVSKNAAPAKTLQELLAWIKAKPEPATAGTAGAGSGSHIAGLALESATGIKLQYVPYRGTAPALNDLVAGQIDIIVDQQHVCWQDIHCFFSASSRSDVCSSSVTMELINCSAPSRLPERACFSRTAQYPANARAPMLLALPLRLCAAA